MVENMRQFGRERVRYIEPQFLPGRFVDHRWEAVMTEDEAAKIFAERHERRRMQRRPEFRCGFRMW